MEENFELKNLRSTMKFLESISEKIPEKDYNIKTIPSIFNRTYDENFISDYLAYILNPLHNGIGLEPIFRLVEGYSEKAINILKNLTIAEKNKIEIIREYSFYNGRRIDILIKLEGQLIIAIENKIFAAESENQTVDYAESIYEIFPDYEHLLFYLTPKGEDPISEDFIAISYGDLIHRLKGVKFDYRDDIRRRVIFDDFILHVEENIMVKRSKQIAEHTKLYLDYYETIRKLEHYFKKDSLMAFEEFEEMVRNIFEGEDWEFNIKADRSWHTIYKKSWNISGLFIHHEFWISSENILVRDKFIHLIEVEGSNRNIFLDLYDEEYEKLKDEYISHCIAYRPRNRKHAIARRELDNYFKADYKDENRLAEEVKKCKFIDDAIERVLERYLKEIN